MRADKKQAQQGSVIVYVLALIAALSLIGVISVRHMLHHHKLTLRAQQHTVLRTLAEGGVTAAKVFLDRGKNPPRRILKQKIDGMEGEVGCRVLPAAGLQGKQVISTATLRTPDSRQRRYEIRARLVRRGQRYQVQSWQERAIP